MPVSFVWNAARMGSEICGHIHKLRGSPTSSSRHGIKGMLSCMVRTIRPTSSHRLTSNLHYAAQNEIERPVLSPPSAPGTHSSPPPHQVSKPHNCRDEGLVLGIGDTSSAEYVSLLDFSESSSPEHGQPIIFPARRSPSLSPNPPIRPFVNGRAKPPTGI